MTSKLKAFTTAATFIFALGSAPAVLAKGHDQGSAESAPGSNVGAETVGPAQGLANGRGPGGQTGNSGNAGNPGNGEGGGGGAP